MKNNYKEIISYIFFGIITTLTNIIIYFILRKIGIWYLISNITAWIISVLVAFFTNKKYVFHSKNNNILKELSLFVTARLFSGIIDTIIMFLGIDILKINELIIKISSNVIVIIINYLLSKLIIFKEKNQNN